MAPRPGGYDLVVVPHAGNLSSKIKRWSISSLLLGCAIMLAAFVATTGKVRRGEL